MEGEAPVEPGSLPNSVLIPALRYIDKG